MYRQLDRETLTTLIRECVTVVKPGETLIVRVPNDWTPDQAMSYQEYAARVAADYAPGLRIIVLIGDELAIAGLTLNDPDLVSDGQPVSAP